MADNNVIDELQLKVKGDANSAIANLSKLQTQLRNTAKSIGSVQAAVKGLNGVDMTFKKLGNINVGNLSAAITQLERLSRIKLDNIVGKKLDLNVSVTGASEAAREIEATKKAVNSVDPKKYADKLANMFNITDKGSLKVLREQFKATLQSLGDGEIQVDNNALFKPILSEGEVARSSFDQYINDMKGKYKEFIDYVNHNKFYINKDAYAELNGSQEVFGDKIARYFTTSQKNSVDLNGTWDDMVSNASRFKDVFDSVTRSDEIFAGMLTKPQEQAVRLRDTILRVKEALDTVKVSTLSKEEKEMAVAQPTRNVFGDMAKEYQRNFDKNMRDSVGKIPLDVVLDENSVTAQIQKMIENASKKPYSFPIKVNVEQADLRQQFTDIIKGLDVSGLGDISEKLRATSVAIKEMSSVDVKSGGVSTFVNSIRKLAEVDLSKFDITPITQIQGVVSEVANMGKLESGVVRLVSALARLANAGQKTTAASSALPVLGTNLHKVATGLASAGAIPSELNAFVSAISQLANAGNRTIDTAVNLKALGDAIRALITDLNGAPQANESLIRMTEALGQIASAGGRAGSAAKSIGKSIQGMADERANKAVSRLDAVKNALANLVEICQKAGSYVGRGVQKIVTSFKQLRSAGNGLQGATSSIKNMIGAMVGFRGITGLGSLLKQTIELGADLTEIDHIIESVFADKSGVVDTWAKNAIEQFGIAEHSAKRYAGTLSSMFQASQIGYMDAGKMSLDLVGLAGDLSAFYNIDTETAFNKIRSGMAGMVRPLRDLGIDLTAATLEEFRLAQGIQTSYSQMSQAEKVMLRYQYLMATTKTQQGDFERTQYSTANAVRTLQAYIQAIGTQIGAGLVTALRRVIVWLNKLMAHILKAAQMFSSFMQTIFGKYKGGASGIAMEGLGDAADYAEDLGGAADSAASGLGDAADSAKQLKKDLSVLPFDELNQLNKDREEAASGSGTGGVGGGAGLGAGGITDGLLDWDGLVEDELEGSALRAKLNAWATQLQKDFLMHDWEGLGKDLADGLNRGLQKVYDLLDPEEFKKKVDPWIHAVTTTFNSFVDNFDFNLLGRTFGRGINDFVHVANETIEGIDWRNLGSKLADGANGLMAEVDFTEVGHLIGNKFMVFWNTLNGFVHDFHWDELGKSIANTINGLNEKLDLSVVADTLATGTNGVFTALGTLADETHWNEIATNIANGIVTFIDTMEWEKNAENLKNFITKLCEAITNAVDDVGPEKWEELGQGIATMLAGVPWAKVLKTVGHVIVVALGGILKGLFSEPEGTLAAAVIFGLGLLKFKHSSFGQFAGNLATALTGDTLSGHIKTAFKKLFKKSATEAAGDSTVTSAAEAAGKSTARSWATGWSKFLSSGAGTALLEVGAIGATLIAAKEFSEFWDKKRGGNGMLTDMGTGVEDWIGKMAEAKMITKEQNDELFKLKEEQENYGASTEEVSKKIIEKLVGWNVSVEDAEQIARQMINTGQGLSNEYEAIADTAATCSSTQKALAGDIDFTGVSVSQAKQDLRNAIFEMEQLAIQSGDTSGRYSEMLNWFDSTEAHTTTAQQAYNLVKNMIEEVGGDADLLNKILGEDYPLATEEAVSASNNMNNSVGVSSEKIKEMKEVALQNVNAVKNKALELAGSFLKIGDSTNSYKNTTEKNTADAATSANGSFGIIGSALGTLTSNIIRYVSDSSSEFTKNERGFSSLSGAAQTAESFISKSFQWAGEKISEFQKNSSSDLQTAQNSVIGYRDQTGSALEENKSTYDRWQSSIAGFMSNAITKMTSVKDESKIMSEGSAEHTDTMKTKVGLAFESMMNGASALNNSFAEELSGLARTTESVTLEIKRILLSQNLELWRQGKDLGDNIKNGFAEGMNGFGETISGAMNGIWRTLMSQNLELWRIGQSMGQSLANGFSSVHIPMPHMYVAWWQQVNFGDGGYMFYPEFGLQWYRKGGLFQGGKGQMIGIAEDGRDEAVLPLEDRRAMAKIGSAIADAGGSSGGQDEFVDKVANRLAEIIMMHQDNEQAPIFNIEVKTENDEVLARAVSRGQRRLDYRNNPTPRMAY